MTKSKLHKAQSAMEYLMTYGWAILIIAIILSALFALGVFSGSSFSTSSCIADTGYLCTSAAYLHSNANILVTVGQETGESWIAANIVFVPEGTPFAQGVPTINFNSLPACTLLTTSNIGLPEGVESQVLLPVNSISFPVIVGTPVTGTIWAQYTYAYTSKGIQQKQTGYAQIASVNLKAT